jgi:RNA polymerase sigma-70 factor (ECF subfamily)
MKVIISERQYKLLLENVSFDEVYKKTYPNMFRQVCMKYAKGDEDLAKDFCQIGYLRVNDKLNTYTGEGSLEGWVRRVLVTTIINELRKRSLDTTSDFDFERTDFEDAKYSEDWMGGSITTSDIINAIDSLPEAYRRVVFLHYFENKSLDEIGKMLGTHAGTQRGYLFRARNMLKEKLGSMIDKYLKV